MAAIANDPESAEAPAAALSAWNADLLLHPTRSREKHTEGLIARVRAASKVALESDLANCTPEERAAFDAGYDELIYTSRDVAAELERHADVLWFFGVESVVRPRVLLTDADRRAGETLLGEQTGHMVLAPSARWPIKHYPAWAEAIAQVWSGIPGAPAFFVVGGPDAASPAAEISAALTGTLPELRVIDLTGGPDLRTTCAVISSASVCLGNDTFTAHAAAALGVPSVTIVGGGHFGRFAPYAPDSVSVINPLDCFGCDWRCVHRAPHCIRDIPPDAVAEAIRLAMTPNTTGKPRVVAADATRASPGGPRAAPLPAWCAHRVDLTRHRRTIPEPAR